jgi:hypothetical protein
MNQLDTHIVKSLPIPMTGNKIYFFGGALLQSKQAPRGFGVCETAAGCRSFVLDYRIVHRQ